MTPLELARSIEPDFPSSSGRPFRTPDPELLQRRHELAAAARGLDVDDANEIAGRAWRLWMAARELDGGRAFLRDVLDRPGASPTRWRAIALYGDGLFAFWQGARDDLRSRSEQALEVAQQAGDDEALALAYLGLSRSALEDGDHERGRELAERARAHARRVSDVLGQAPLHMHAQSLRAAGDLDGAAALFEESLELNRRVGDEGMVTVEHHNLAAIAVRRGDGDAAERHSAQFPPADSPYDEAMGKLIEAGIALCRGEPEQADARLCEAEATLADAGIEAATDDRADLDWLREQLECAAR